MRNQNRINTAAVLLTQYGITMTEAEFRELFFPGCTVKTLRNRACAGTIPRIRSGVLDTQEVGRWWDEQVGRDVA